MPVLKPGMRLRSAVCTTEVMVIQAPDREVMLACGGSPMHAPGEPGSSAPVGKPVVGDPPGTLIGKRYVNAAGDLELLCTRPGAGTLGADGAPLAVKGAKPLPSSD
jgi:hypothetical protein